MIHLDHYFGVWQGRLAYLKRALDKIQLLPKEAKYMQALLVRNECLNCIQELESAFEPILAEYDHRQDDLFQNLADEISLATFNKKPWPLDASVSKEIAEQKKNLENYVVLLRKQANDFQVTFSQKQAALEREAHVIIGQLTVVYGVSPRHRKKKP
jgi:hypothetical protein